MRIISQDGTLDIPYKLYPVVVMDYGSKHGVAAKSESYVFRLAEYDDKKQALEALAAIRRAYVKGEKVMFL